MNLHATYHVIGNNDVVKMKTNLYLLIEVHFLKLWATEIMIALRTRIFGKTNLLLSFYTTRNVYKTKEIGDTQTHR
jgi:hypothetical protein